MLFIKWLLYQWLVCVSLSVLSRCVFVCFNLPPLARGSPMVLSAGVSYYRRALQLEFPPRSGTRERWEVALRRGEGGLGCALLILMSLAWFRFQAMEAWQRASTCWPENNDVSETLVMSRLVLIGSANWTAGQIRECLTGKKQWTFLWSWAKGECYWPVQLSAEIYYLMHKRNSQRYSGGY